MRYLTTLLILLLSIPIHAEPLLSITDKEKIAPTVHAMSAQSMPPGTDVVPKLVDVTLGLLTILVLIGVIALAVRRFARLQVAAKGHLKVVGGMHLGTRERLVLIQVGEKQLLLGVTPGRIDKLHTLDEVIPLEAEPQSEDDSFYKKLSSFMRTK